jgi:hypothetical protein
MSLLPITAGAVKSGAVFPTRTAIVFSLNYEHLLKFTIAAMNRF